MAKWTVEEAIKLDIRKKFIKKEIGEKLAVNLPDGSKANISLSHHVRYFGKDYAIAGFVEVLWERCRYGGCRKWLICPKCAEKKMVLFWIPNSRNFFCRNCLSLTYESSQQSTKDPFWKVMIKYQKYKEKIKKKYIHKKKKEKYFEKIFE